MSDHNVMPSEKMEDVRQMLNSRGWIDSYAPSIVALITESIRSLLDPAQSRVENKPDDYLRGQIAAFNDVLTLGANSLQEHDADVEKMRKERANSENYVQRASDGIIGPVEHDDFTPSY